MAKVKENRVKDKNPNSGRSKGAEYPFGKRRMQEGKERAPKSLRRQHAWLKDCSDEQLERAGVK